MPKNNYIIESMYAKYADMSRLDEARNPKGKNRVRDKVDLGGAPIINRSPKGKPLSELTPKERAKWEKEKKELKKKWSDDYKYDTSDSVDLGGAPLAEARNPENDEVNAAIKRYLSSDKAYIPKKDKELFNKYGITPDKLSKKFGSQKIVTGAGGRNGSTVISTDTMLNLHPDYDYANSLTKKKLSGGDIEQPTNDMRYYVNILNQRPDTRTPEDTSKMSWNQLKSLQPYIDEKSRIINSNEDIKRAKQREAEQIEQIKQDTQRQISYKQKDKDDTMRRAKLKHNAHNKNESLSLKESMFGYSRINEIIDFLADIGYDDEDEACALFLSVLLNFVTEDQVNQAIEEVTDYVEG